MKFLSKTFYISLTLFAYNSDAIGSSASLVDFGQVNVLDTERKSVHPETLIYDDDLSEFFVGSAQYRAVHEIDESGEYSQIIEDDDLYSLMGVAVNEKQRKVFVTNSYLGVSVNSDYDGTLKVAELGIYVLKNGNKMAYHDLASLLPYREYFANGVALNTKDNACVTDSIAPAIYKTDADNAASVFIENSKVEGERFGFKELVYSPYCYLSAVKKTSGALYKLPLEEPPARLKTNIDERSIAGDRMVFIDDNGGALNSNKQEGVANNSAYKLKDTRKWQLATPASTIPPGDVYPTYPTTGADEDGKPQVIHFTLQVTRPNAPPPTSIYCLEHDSFQKARLYNPQQSAAWVRHHSVS